MVDIQTQTGSQVHVSGFDNRVTDRRPMTFQKMRKMRKDPVISLARAIAVAPVLLSDWTYESEEDDQLEFVKWQMERIKSTLVRTAFLGQLDFGWKAYEKVYAIEDTKFGQRLVLAKLKPLLNDITFQLRAKRSGVFLGLYQQQYEEHPEVYMDADHSFFVNFDDEGVGNYGESDASIAESAYDAWNAVSESAGRYDEKLAASHWIVHYPPGKQEEFQGKKDVDNYDVAMTILSQLKASGGYVVPSSVESIMDEVDKVSTGWKIELLSSPGASTDFVTRMKYLDALKVRAYKVTERAVIEGTYGTKAESESHMNATLMMLHLKHMHLVEMINWYLVNPLTMANYGAEDTVKVVANPLSDEKKALFMRMFEHLFTNPDTFIEIADSIDKSEVLSTLGFPLIEEGDVDGSVRPTLKVGDVADIAQ